MLTLLRTCLSPPLSVALLARDLTVGTIGVDEVCWTLLDVLGTGMAGLEGVRSFDGACGLDAERNARLVEVGAGRLLRVLDNGRGGRAVVGGSYGESAGRGKVVVMMDCSCSRARHRDAQAWCGE
jgi:hypothetical protein